MKRGRPLFRWPGILLLCAAISIICIEAYGKKEPLNTPESGRPDLVTIDTLAAFGKLELPPVTFFHDKHTEALLKEKKDCKTCHLVEDDKLSLTFKRSKATRPAEIKQIYHSNCIGCHMDMAAAGKKSGPPDGMCRSCHNAEPKIAAARLDVEVNKILHFRHVGSKSVPSKTTDKDNCNRCHHVYDKEAKKIVYVKGKEATCGYCHLEKQKDDVKSLRQASHLECVLCHLDLANKEVKETGPYVCAGCHGKDGQVLVAKKNQEAVAKLPDKEIPRLKAGQPDFALITLDPKLESAKALKPVLMNPVAFDHKAHERSNDSCHVCHHKTVDSCQTCHTLLGKKEGGSVRFEEAMHLRASKQSCLGCHGEKQAALSCAGCHSHMDKIRRPDDATCRQCHMPLPKTVLQGRGELRDDVVLTPKQKSGIAEVMLKGRNMKPGVYAVEDIPEKAVIRELVDQYEPAEMPHRKIVLTLMKGMKDNSLAGYFHSEQGTICQGCHHNSPAAKKPPRCGNCHGKPFDPRQPNRPGLQAAFHGECMGCHKAIKLAKPAATACTECHKEKKKEPA